MTIAAHRPAGPPSPPADTRTGHRPRVLYITGFMRSGSTLLGNVLNELPGVQHVGELYYLWRNGVLGSGSNSSCGCGRALRDCAVWSSVIGSGASDPGAYGSRSPGSPATGTVPGADAVAHRMVMLQQSLLRTRHVRARLAEARGRTAPAPGVTELLDRAATIYRRLSALEAGRLIVDGSKYPAEAAALLGRADLDVRVLHIVRDPRATALSYRRAKDYIDPMGPARSTGYWTAFNLASELVGEAAAGRYLRIRHEDLCRSPAEVLTTVLGFAGLGDRPPVDDEGRVRLGANHTVTGNPDRLRQGVTSIRPDERWRTELPPRSVATVTALAGPLLARYGYPLLPGSGGR